ncbi:MAG: hypothetical protein BWY71_01772 [Planctomycetes bacterium ADurb.Bin412]|nr:MAG: hypothetical protein BWY71_01772 [Planctomycetes bacterium ADurb.Bin412]
MGFYCGNDLLVIRLDHGAIQGRGDQRRMLGPHIVSHDEHIHPGPYPVQKRLDGGNPQIGDFPQQGVGKLLIYDQIHHPVFHSAHVIDQFAQCGTDIADQGIGGFLIQIFRLLGQAFVLAGMNNLGPGIVFDIRNPRLFQGSILIGRAVIPAIRFQFPADAPFIDKSFFRDIPTQGGRRRGFHI